jgi:thiol-disulfide isomerase/thioredoxin
MKYLFLICALAGIVSYVKSNRAAQPVTVKVKTPTEAYASARESSAITPAELQQITHDTSGMVVLVFWQPNCGSCVMMDPIVAQTEKEYPRLPVIRINTRLPENREIHDKYGIRGTPTFIVLEKDKILARNNGPFRNKDDFHSFLRSSKKY